MVVLAAVMLVATPLLAFGGGLAGHVLSRRSALELDRWRRREETMRMLRWAVEMVVGGDDESVGAGSVAMSALLRSPLLDDEDFDLVASLADAVARGTMAA
ncbi:MAG TPA: hypothetical protein PLZ93_23360 [Nocardioides sp.]|uniref:hypothetical protein n=1 Tax=uncultured Nocardioides sp. TaxID=198441 RepID=UPI000EC5FAA3|nr:hypothetical protein [uncultured Nocardioides sp.]HCB03949.1 hypothetical protein [Nocardioides sp.]HRD60578.1 hypothetical protein [Nocardioides sp.]HRI98585.1 hypothetical protein [Nocardioides sp.]HRK48602.1 hypothetical protein [Nocardioides sp.]